MPSVARLFLVILSAGLAAGVSTHAMSASVDISVDVKAAQQIAGLALDCVDREYPNQIQHAMAGDDDLGPPRRLTPAFYGCFDWHSSVHGHWLLARLVRLFPEAGFADKARAKLAVNLTADHLLAEAAYMRHPERAGFERPYGLAWLLQLVAELDEWDDAQANRWREDLRPLENVAVERLTDWIPKLHYPIRVGEHAQTAFAFGLIHDYAVQVDDGKLKDIIEDAAGRFYAADQNCPLGYEPSGHDFLSPCLAEADFMRRVMDRGEFAAWLDDFLPAIGRADWLPVATVTDRSDGKLAHIDGLNLSRAWMLAGMASALPDDDARVAALDDAAGEHARAGLDAIGIDYPSGRLVEREVHYAGGHWLGSFAVYLLSRRGY